MVNLTSSKELLEQLPKRYNAIQKIADNLNKKRLRTPNKGKKYSYQNVWAVLNRGKHYDESVLLELINIHTEFFDNEKKIESIIKEAKKKAIQYKN